MTHDPRCPNFAIAPQCDCGARGKRHKEGCVSDTCECDWLAEVDADAMTHDPLCPNIPEHWDGQILWPSRCQCDLIARVRADEREQPRTG